MGRAPRHAQSCGARTGISGKFSFTGADRLGDSFKGWCRSTSNHIRQMPRTGGRLAAAFPQEALHDAVFKAVKRDDSKAPARLEHTLCGFEPVFKLTQFSIDVDADGLKSARGGVAFLPFAPANGPAHDRCQFGRPRYRARRNNGARNPA